MPFRYFHLENGVTTLNADGVEVCDALAMRAEATATVPDVLCGDDSPASLRNGRRLRLWVTDKPNGAGKTLYAIHLRAVEAD